MDKLKIEVAWEAITSKLKYPIREKETDTTLALIRNKDFKAVFQTLEAFTWESRYIKREKGLDTGQAFLPQLCELDKDFKDALQGLSFKEGCLLELGCGEGYQAVAFAEYGFDVTATDVADTALLHAKKLAFDHGVNIKYHRDSILHTKLKTKFDIVSDRGCFTILPEPFFDLYAKNVFQLLKTNGRLLLKLDRGKADRVDSLLADFVVEGQTVCSYSEVEFDYDGLSENAIFYVLRPKSSARFKKQSVGTGYTYPNLKEQLDMLLPCLGQALINDDQVSGLSALAARLTPILQGGFECRLGPDKPQVDLHQCVYPTDNELTLLQSRVSAIDSTANPDARLGGARLRAFLTEWSEPSSPLHGSIPEVWMEYDNKDPRVHPVPSIFISLAQKVSPSTAAYSKVAVPALDYLLGSDWYVCKDNLYRCFAYCPDGAFVSDIGVMLSRSSQSLRVNIRRLHPDSLPSYLQRLGLREEADKLKALVVQLFGFSDLITVCLDIGREIHSKIGFECIIRGRPSSPYHWDAFLDYLVAEGLCEPQKRDALLEWPGHISPVNAKAPWPDHLIAASLLKPQDYFSVFNRELSHIKIVWQPQRALEAKAYLLYQHRRLPL